MERLSRKQLFDLVWSEPMKNLSVRFGISDVGLKKVCLRAAIPTPDRGYWAKRESGKGTNPPALSERPPGMDDEVVVAGGRNYWYQNWDRADLRAPLPPPPEFPEPIEAVRERIAKVIGKLSVPREIRDCHPAVDRLLKQDDIRREKRLATSYPTPWHEPQFDSPFERRRLRILNTLFLAAERMNGKPCVGRDADSVHLTFFQQHVRIKLSRCKQRTHGAPQRLNDPRLSVAILNGLGSEQARITWEDDDTGKLETRITEIVVEVVLTAEVQHREGATRHYQWLVERKGELEEEERKRKLEAERVAIQRQKRLEQARVDRLLDDAAAFQQAGAIRKYVETIRIARSSGSDPVTEDLERWSQWALAQADRIDPIVGDKFLAAMRDEDGMPTKTPKNNLSV